jgi:hypothetical protein
MTTLKEIKGTKVQALATDPTDSVEGQIWYNTTSLQIKSVIYQAFGVWSTGGNLGTARYGLAGAGTQTAGLGFGGRPSTAATEEYSGYTWVAGGNMGTARYSLGGGGTQAAGLAFGGTTGTANTAATEEYTGVFGTPTASILTTS